MSYHYDRGYNNYNHHRGGFRHHQPRINENEVPQSKHTVFIRGLGGDVTTDEIKEYIGDRFGNISFDFVKHTQDRSKVFVAVRFEKREEAKEFMDNYSDREFMGYRCELSWFRDIRRYCAYQRTKQIRSNSQRRRRRSDSEDSRHSSRRSSPARRSRSASRDRSRYSRSQSRISRSRSRSNSRSRVSNHSRSRSPDRRSRSVSRGSRKSNRAESRNGCNESIDNHSDDEVEKQRLRKKESHSKRHREASVSDDDLMEADKLKRKIKEELHIPLPPKAPTQTKPKAPIYIPPPSVEMTFESSRGDYGPAPPQPTNPYQNNQRSYQKEPSPAVHATSYAVPMEEESTPRVVIKEAIPPVPTPAPSYPVINYHASSIAPPIPNPYAQHANVQAATPQYPSITTSPTPVMNQEPPAPTPAAASMTPTSATAAASQTAFVPRQVSRIEILMPASLPAPPPVPVPAPFSSTSNQTLSGTAHFTLDPAIFPKSHKLFGHLKAFQSALLSTVKYEPPTKKDDGEELSSLRLSSFGNDDDTEEAKALEREDKLARLTDEQMMRFHIKKKQYEQAFHNDCETYSVVTRALLAKDESLQFGLKMSLLENMEDIHKKMMQRVDDLLDALLQT